MDVDSIENTWPKISIVTPSYNQGHFLESTIKSVLSQQYGNLEYIIIDGGSSDNSKNIIKKYASQLTYWISEPDSGHAAALNKGFSRATGDILAWINSDDMYTPWAFSIIGEIFAQHPDIHWVKGTHGHWDSRGRQISTNVVYKNMYDYLLGNYKWIQQESVFFTRDLWERSGAYIDEGYSLMVDGELWCRFFQHEELWNVSPVLSGYRIHDTNRANRFSEKVDREMESAINDLRSNITADQRKVLEKLETIRRLQSHLTRYKIPIKISNLTRQIFQTALTNNRYLKLVYEPNKKIWEKHVEAGKF